MVAKWMLLFSWDLRTQIRPLCLDCLWRAGLSTYHEAHMQVLEEKCQSKDYYYTENSPKKIKIV